MSTTVIAFFNNKGGVGKTTLVYHVARMFANRGLQVVAADLDPQGNLTAAFLDDDRLEELWPSNGHSQTVFGALQPLKRGVGDVSEPHLEIITNKLCLVLGDMALSTFEDQLSEAWPKCLDKDERAFRVTSAFWRIVQLAAASRMADVVLIDLGPNLGAINRAALIASDFVVIPLGPDLFSLQGLQNLGPTLRRWRVEWRERASKNPAEDLILPRGSMHPVGYVVLQHSVRLDRPVHAYDRWIGRIPFTYQESVLDQPPTQPLTIDTDENCIAKLKHYRSLMPMAHEARKPVFELKPADGAIGAHSQAVKDAYTDFLQLARNIAARTAIKEP